MMRDVHTDATLAESATGGSLCWNGIRVGSDGFAEATEGSPSGSNQSEIENA
jgi:hypothetical protein